MVELYSHQETALNLLRLNDGFALFMEQGTGKASPCSSGWPSWPSAG